MNAEIKLALNEFVKKANQLLDNKIVAAYCIGSATYNDFHNGYSDLDFFIIVDKEITNLNFNQFHDLRMEFKKSQDPYLSVLEGEIISLTAINNKKDSNTIYWGTSKDKFNPRYNLSGFSMKIFIDKGYLIYGKDIRDLFDYPSRYELLDQVDSLISTIRKYATQTTNDIHSIDWLFLISQSILWLKTGSIDSKTYCARSILDNYDYFWNSYLRKALEIRLNPKLAETNEIKNWLISLAPIIDKACTDLEHERNTSIL